MENKALSKTEIMAIRIADILELIARCDVMITNMLEVGMEKGFMKKKYNNTTILWHTK